MISGWYYTEQCIIQSFDIFTALRTVTVGNVHVFGSHNQCDHTHKPQENFGHTHNPQENTQAAGELCIESQQ